MKKIDEVAMLRWAGAWSDAHAYDVEDAFYDCVDYQSENELYQECDADSVLVIAPCFASSAKPMASVVIPFLAMMCMTIARTMAADMMPLFARYMPRCVRRSQKSWSMVA